MLRRLGVRALSTLWVLARKPQHFCIKCIINLYCCMCGNKETYGTFFQPMVCETAEKQISEVVWSQSLAPDCVHYKSDVVF